MYNVYKSMNVTDELSCSICLEIAKSAVETNCCHHIFCEICLKRYYVNCETCPQCRSQFSFTVSHLTRRMISNMPVTCIFEHCDLSLPRSEVKIIIYLYII